MRNLIDWFLKVFFPSYAAPVSKVFKIEQKLAALDNGQLFSRIIEVFASEGFDLSTMFSKGLDLRHIEDIQTALNLLVLEPAGNKLLTVDGILNFEESGEFRQAVMGFQRKYKIPVDGLVGKDTIATLRKALVASNISVK